MSAIGANSPLKRRCHIFGYRGCERAALSTTKNRERDEAGLGIYGMIEEARGRIDYGECGTGPTIVLAPGSCSTGAAWRPVIATWNGQFRCVAPSLLGYGGTVERRTASNSAISHEA